MALPPPNQRSVRFPRPGPTLSLIILTVLGTAAGGWLFLALESTGLSLSGTATEIARGTLTTAVLAIVLHRFLVFPLSLQIRYLTADVRQLREDKRDAEDKQATLTAELTGCRQTREREAQSRRGLEDELRQATEQIELTVSQRTAPLETRVQTLQAELTQLHQTADALRESERRSRSLVELASGGIWMLDPGGRTSFINRHGAETLGFSVAEMLGREPADFVFVEDLPEEAKGFDLRHGSVPDPFEFRMRHKLGHELRIRASASCMISEEGDYQGALILFEDVTAQRAEQARCVREQRLDSASTLAHGLAQELSNSISAILLSAQSLRPPQDRDDQELIAAIKSSAQRGAELINEVLTFTRGVEGERVILRPARLVQNLAGTLQEVFPRNIQIDCRADETVWDVKGDPDQLRVVLLRLCVNARDAMPKGGVLRLHTRNVHLDNPSACAGLGLKEGAYVVISIQDSGAPVPAALQERAFEPFFSAREQSGGTGLSLSAALGVARSHGGTIELRSAPSEGSTFLLYLPRIQESERAAGDQAGAKAAPRRSGIILLVEQEPALRDVIPRTLARSGLRVLTAATGSEALHLLGVHRAEVRIILADLNTLSIDSPALARVARELNSAIRIIAVTAFGRSLGQTEKLTALQTIGFHRLLPKPCTLDELLAAIHSELAHA